MNETPAQGNVPTGPTARPVGSSLRARMRLYALAGFIVVGGWLYFTIQSVYGLYDSTVQIARFTELRERVSEARVLVFSMHDTETLVRRAFELGACGFVSKSSAPDRLIDAVHCVSAGRRYLGPDLPQHLLDGGGAVDRFAALTPREFEIFRQLARGESLADCARTLHLSPKTVANHQSSIKDKLGVASVAALVHLAIRHGVITAGGH